MIDCRAGLGSHFCCSVAFSCALDGVILSARRSFIMLSVRRGPLYEYLSHIVHFISSLGIYLRICTAASTIRRDAVTASCVILRGRRETAVRSAAGRRPAAENNTHSQRRVIDRTAGESVKLWNRVKIHDRQTFVADVGLYLWDRHPTYVYQ